MGTSVRPRSRDGNGVFGGSDGGRINIVEAERTRTREEREEKKRRGREC